MMNSSKLYNSYNSDITSNLDIISNLNKTYEVVDSDKLAKLILDCCDDNVEEIYIKFERHELCTCYHPRNDEMFTCNSIGCPKHSSPGSLTIQIDGFKQTDFFGRNYYKALLDGKLNFNFEGHISKFNVKSKPYRYFDVSKVIQDNSEILKNIKNSNL